MEYEKWYLFYSSFDSFEAKVQLIENEINTESSKLQQVAAEITEFSSTEKLQQAVAEIPFPLIFGFVPWGHHVNIITKCKDLNEALFYIKQTIEQRMTRFLLELGEGWAFIGRQKELIISGKTRKIDLLFYHIYLRCYVVLKLKVTSFEPEHAGKLNFYDNLDL